MGYLKLTYFVIGKIPSFGEKSSMSYKDIKKKSQKRKFQISIF
jgi:hypothetical protein